MPKTNALMGYGLLVTVVTIAVIILGSVVGKAVGTAFGRISGVF